MARNKKIIILIAGIIVLCTQSFSNWVFYAKTNASGPTEEDKLVAIFVDSTLYNTIKSDMQWYTTQYIQSRFTRTKALVFPVDTNKIKANDIQNILSNLYYGGEKDTPSTLIGTVLIGNIPLPVVKKDSYIFPSVIPYTDLERPSYTYDPPSTYYLPSSSSVDNKQELFHGVITFDTNKQYVDYFQKLKTYASNPAGFVDKKMRFEDFPKLQETFTKANLPLYENGQIHDEDLTYHRYSAALYNMLVGNSNQSAIDILSSAGNIPVTNNSNDPDYPSTFGQSYAAGLSNRKDGLTNQASAGQAALSGLSSTSVPTLLASQAINQQIQNYQSLFGAEYGSMISDSINTNGRWTGVDIGTHITKTSVLDATTSQLLYQLNNALEKTLDNKIKADHRGLNIPLLVSHQNFDYTIVPLAGTCIQGDMNSNEENFYFGKNAYTITGADQTTWYRGTYGNYSDVAQAKALPRSGNGSIGQTMGFGNQQVMASRGYNTFLAQADANIYDFWRTNCPHNGNQNFESYVGRFRGGVTPVNVNPATNKLKLNIPQIAYNPSYNYLIGGPLFDIAGSILVDQAITTNKSSTAPVNTYGSLIKVFPHTSSSGPLGLGTSKTDIPRCQPRGFRPSYIYNFFNAVKTTAIVHVVNGSIPRQFPTCGSSDVLVYKTIDSVVKHTSPTQGETSKMNLTTKDRPIDSERYVTLQGLGGQDLTLKYPDLYEVPVYKQNGGISTLMSADEIKQSIITYLKNSISGYNAELQKQNTNIAAYTAANIIGLNLLRATDPLASPQGRSYQTLPADYFVTLLGDQRITQIAELLYVKNVGWSTRPNGQTVGDNISNLESNFHIENKIHAVLDRQLTNGVQGILVQTGGYELAYIRSRGIDSITTLPTPSIVTDADEKKVATNAILASNNSSASTTVDIQGKINDQTCGVSSNGTVPVLQWPKALTCWWKNLKETSLKNAVEISYKNAQGPVYVLPFLRGIVKGPYQDYETYLSSVYKDGILGQSEIKQIRIDLPYQKVIRGAQLPFSIVATDQSDNAVTSLLFPMDVFTDLGAIVSSDQPSNEIQTTALSEPLLLDTSSIDRSMSRIHLTIKGPLYPTGETGSTFPDTKEIILVDGALRVSYKGATATDINVTLPDEGYTQKIGGVPSVRDTILPQLVLQLTDSTGQPLTSPATITSANGLIQPGSLQIINQNSIIGNVATKQFSEKHLRTLTGGNANIYLMPNMRAGDDVLTISVPGMPDRTVAVHINPGSPFSVSLVRTSEVGNNNLTANVSAHDKRDNIITTPTTISYTFIGNIADNNGAKSGSITTTGGSVINATYNGVGDNYIYASIQGIPLANQQPSYLHVVTPMTLWPTTGLNAAYLMLDGKDRGNMESKDMQTMISSSPKLISISTNLYSPQNALPVAGLIDIQGKVVTGDEITIRDDNGVKNIVANNTIIGQIKGVAPYTSSNIILQNDSYAVQPSRAGGSSNQKAFAIVHTDGAPLDDEPEQDFGPLHSYAGGTTVGEAQKAVFGPERINYGDPFLQNGGSVTPLPNTQITLLQDTSKTIKKVMEFDIDNDGRKDLLILNDDDTIRFMKNYGGTPPYTQLGGLLAIADGVQDIWLGDSNNDGLQDIFIKTKKNTLRVYRNQAGSFDINGMPVCLNVPSGDTSLSNVRQLFVADMNNDNQSDIITYDSRGQIRIFYGGSTSGNGYYVSTDPSGCDAGRQARQKDHTLTVATYGLQLQQNTPIYDNSLIHWQGLTLPDDSVGTDSDTTTPSVATGIPNPANPSSINLQNLIDANSENLTRYTATPYDQLPSYESATLDTIAYIPARLITGNDALQTYKTFAYVTGDTINVTVTIKANKATHATYIEELRGPRNVSRDTDESIFGFDRGSLGSDATINWSIGNGYQFLVDNITMRAGQTIQFSYPVTYSPPKTVTINVTDTDQDNWKDITVVPIDGCQSQYQIYHSNQGRDYTLQNASLASTSTALADAQSGINANLASVMSGFTSAQSNNGVVSSMPGLDQFIEGWNSSDTVLNNILNSNTQANINLDLSNVIDTQQLEKDIDTTLQGLCKGFGGGGGGGVPTPFNMAFLAPGTYNVMGCKVFEDKGLPVFFFPGTLQTPVGPIPFPRGLKGGGDSFYWVPGGVYPSMIRIYVAPTLTASVGTAICIGPYGLGINLPNPIKHIAGNCIVIAKGSGGGGGGGAASSNGGLTDQQVTTANTNAALTATQQSCPYVPTAASNSKPFSPFGLTAVPKGTDLSLNNVGAIPDGTHLGMFSFSSQPTSTHLSQQTAGQDPIKAGKPIQLQIEGGNVKGLMKCIISKWLNNQMRYIINNLTSMSINVILPDVKQLFAGFKNIDFSQLNTLDDTFQKGKGDTRSPMGQALKNMVTKTKGETASATSMSDTRGLGNALSNPFSALAQWFEQVPLIHINTKNVTVQIPFIYNEELIRYQAQLKGFADRAGKRGDEWNMLAKSLAGTCKTETTQSAQEACNQQVAYYNDVGVQMGQLQTSARRNLQTLEEYKRFPLQLQQWMTISQRYLTEVTASVQGLSNDLTSRLNTNAKRFESYVDAIISMIGAVKSRQAIIDLSTNWKSSCGKCTVDNYDYYSCVLGILCPSLPILAIPPFKLPDVYVDLSNIRAGMDVVIPNIQFVPKNIALPSLPDLPGPPTVRLKANIGYTTTVPSLPDIPAPPKLPELPSVIPSININLPTLPPAPKVPRIAPAITSTIKVLGIVTKILCIIKNGIGLVGEAGVKTRIEQMTQRTWSVEPFDSLSITKTDPPLRGFDLKVSTYLNFELNFEGLYNLLDGFTSKINTNTNSVIKNIDESINTVSAGYNDISNTLQDTVDQGNININTQIGTNGIKQGYLEPELVDPAVLRGDIQKGLTAWKQSDLSAQYGDQIKEIDNTLQTPSSVSADIDSITTATTALQGILNKTNKTMAKQQKTIATYDTFLDSLSDTTLIADHDVSTTIGASLYRTSPGTQQLLNKTQSPMHTYISLEEKLTNGFLQALQTHSPSELNMGSFSYNRLAKFFSQTKQKIDNIKGVIEQPKEVDYSALTAVKKIIAPAVQADTLTKNIALRWDEHSIYTNEPTYKKTQNDNMHFTRFYVFDTIGSYEDLKTKVDANGYFTLFNNAFCVWRPELPITSFISNGQSTTTISLQRQNTDQPIYIIMLTDAIYANHENIKDRDSHRRYIVAYASGTDISNDFFSWPNSSTKKIATLMPDTILTTVAFDPAEPLINISFPLTNSVRSYARIYQGDRKQLGTSSHLISPNSAPSAQETLATQRWGDNNPPQAKAIIYNHTDGSIIAQGTNIVVPKNGAYDMIVQWSDDGVVRSNTIQKDTDTASQSFSGDQAKISPLPMGGTGLVYYTTATDETNNKGNQTIYIKFSSPGIAIDNVAKTNNQSVINSSLSQLYPDGFVRFFADRSSVVDMLTGSNKGVLIGDFATIPSSNIVTGGVFYDADSISLFTPNKERIATIEKKTGKITIQPSRVNRIHLQLDLTQGFPSILFIENTTSTTLFRVYLKSQSLQTEQTTGSGFTIETLSSTAGGTFANGSCIKDVSKICVVYVTTNGEIYAPNETKGRISGSYSYNGSITYGLTLDGKPMANIGFIPQPITP